MTLLSSVDAVEETPIDAYLAAQADLTAVERFAQRHEAELIPRQARYYRDLIPLARPEPGQQYGFAVDLDSCTGCKACVTACHSLNGLDDGESWRTVSVQAGGRQTVTSACHHCLDPACLKGCPVDAYEKDPVTGIVVHLDDQCIGCQYCTLTCPWEVPVYNRARGIVRKCDMCQGRLAAGEAPACVQACPNGAISVQVVDTADVPRTLTLPATTYTSANFERLVASEPTYRSKNGGRGGNDHAALAVMLVLTQLAVGAFVAALLWRGGRASAFDAAFAGAAGLLAMGASVFHLGRPRYFYRAVIGLRHSWLSREVVAFGAFTGLVVPYALALWAGRPMPWLGVLTAAAGLAGVACSVLIYSTTGRPRWTLLRVSAQFARTTAVCGAAAVGAITEPAAILALALVVAAELRSRLRFFHA